MTIISTGNNFGHAGQVGFNAFLSENLIVLNGRFAVDTTSEEYRSAEALEVYLPQLPMAKSAVSNTYIRASVVVGQGTRYERTESIGTVVKTLIKDGNTIRIEKFTEYDGNGSFEILLCSMFTTRGYRGEVAKITKTAVKFTVLSEVSARANDLTCIAAEGWCFIHLYFNTSSSFFSKEIKVQLEGFPEDASADVFLVGGGFRTAAQSGVKAVFKQLSQGWKGLTNSQILAWNALANTQKGKSVLGTSSRISGANLYSRLNFWVVKAGNAALSAPPVLNGVDAPCEADLSLTADSFTFQLPDPPKETADLRLVIMASAPQSRGVTRAYSKAVMIGSPRAVVDEQIDILANYKAAHGEVTSAAPKVFLKYFFINVKTGEKSGEMLGEISL